MRYKRTIPCAVSVGCRLKQAGCRLVLASLVTGFLVPTASYSETVAAKAYVPGSSQEPSGIEMRDGLLFVHVEGAELRAVLDEIARRSGVPIVLGDGVAGRVSIRLTGVTLEAALRKLTRNSALIFQRTPDGESFRIIKAGAYGEGRKFGATRGGPPEMRGIPGPRLGETPGMAREIPSRSEEPGQLLAAEQGGRQRLDRKGRRRFIPGELIIQLKDGVSPAEASQLHRSLGSSLIGRIERLGIQRIRLREGLTEEDAVGQYRSSGLVEIAEKHALRYPDSVVPDDPLFDDQWGLSRVKAPEAWEIIEDKPGVIVAVIDSGVDYLHPDLTGRIWVNALEFDGTEGVDDDDNGHIDDLYGWDFAGADWRTSDGGDSDPMDIDGHGTHVAGIIAAEGNNGQGVAGTDPNSKIMILRVQADNAVSYESWDVVQAIDYAIENGARIVNCSFGGGEGSAIEEAAFARLRDAGIMAVCAAGNDGLNIDLPENRQYPAGYDLDNIVSVAASNRSDMLAGFSNYGLDQVDVMAPGVGIESTTITGVNTNASLAVETGGQTVEYRAIGMAFAGTTGPDGLTGSGYNCGKGYPDEFPPGTSGYIAIIQRGHREDQLPFFFSEKADNAKNAGAIAAVIYNNEPGGFSGTLGSTGDWIPVVSVSEADGTAIVALGGQQQMTLVNHIIEEGAAYAAQDGTSMAAPFVTGIAGMLFSVDSSLGYRRVKSIILDTVDSVPSVAGRIRSGGRANALSALYEYRDFSIVASGDRTSLMIRGHTPDHVLLMREGGNTGQYRWGIDGVGSFSIEGSSRTSLEDSVTYYAPAEIEGASQTATVTLTDADDEALVRELTITVSQPVVATGGAGDRGAGDGGGGDGGSSACFVSALLR